MVFMIGKQTVGLGLDPGIELPLRSDPRMRLARRSDLTFRFATAMHAAGAKRMGVENRHHR